MSGEYICEAIEAIMEYERINEIADLFKMFGDATRVKILFSLFDRELSVTEIVEKSARRKRRCRTSFARLNKATLSNAAERAKI